MSVSPASTPTGVELFCGVGGMTLGFLQAGVQVLCGVDANERAIKGHKRNFPDVANVCADVRSLSAPKIVANAQLPGSRVDILFGGPPCQGFSIGGSMDPSDVRNELMRHFARLVVGFRPSYFVLENVVGLLNPRYRGLLDEFERVVRTGGFTLTKPIRVLDAADFGVPQRRRRVFFLGTRKGNVPLEYPEPLPKDMRPNVWDAIGDISDAYDECQAQRVSSFAGTLGLASTYASVLRGESVDPGALWPTQPRRVRQVKGFAPTGHSQDTVARFETIVPGRQDPISRFIRLRKDGICTTLRAGTNSERGSFMAPRPIHPVKPRCICLREAARLHSFPDWFSFDETKWHGFMQLGNSVPPRLARAVAREVVRAFEASSK